MTAFMHFLLIFWIVISVRQITANDLYEGSACNAIDGKPGACKKITECTSFTARKVSLASVTHCSFANKLPIVCCPGEKPIVQEPMSGGILKLPDDGAVIFVEQKNGSSPFDPSSNTNSIESIQPMQILSSEPEHRLDSSTQSPQLTVERNVKVQDVHITEEAEYIDLASLLRQRAMRSQNIVNEEDRNAKNSQWHVRQTESEIPKQDLNDVSHTQNDNNNRVQFPNTDSTYEENKLPLWLEPTESIRLQEWQGEDLKRGQRQWQTFPNYQPPQQNQFGQWPTPNFGNNWPIQSGNINSQPFGNRPQPNQSYRPPQFGQPQQPRQQNQQSQAIQYPNFQQPRQPNQQFQQTLPIWPNQGRPFGGVNQQTLQNTRTPPSQQQSGGFVFPTAEQWESSIPRTPPTTPRYKKNLTSQYQYFQNSGSPAYPHNAFTNPSATPSVSSGTIQFPQDQLPFGPPHNHRSTTTSAPLDSWMLQFLTKPPHTTAQTDLDSWMVPFIQKNATEPLVTRSTTIRPSEFGIESWMLEQLQKPMNFSGITTTTTTARTDLDSWMMPFLQKNITTSTAKTTATLQPEIEAWMIEQLPNSSSQSATNSTISPKPIAFNQTYSSTEQKPYSAKLISGHNSSNSAEYNSIFSSARPFTTPGITTPTPATTKRKTQLACENYLKTYLPDITYNIINGIPTLPGEFPHMAALGFPSISDDTITFDCGGSLISENFVLTAAHCVFSTNREPTIVRLGKLSLSSNEDELTGVDAGINEIIIYPNYTNRFDYHDVALLRLNRTIPINKYIRPACLNTNINDLSNTTKVIATGWGITDTRRRSPVLLKVALTPVDVASCNNSYLEEAPSRKRPDGLNLGHLCAFDPELKGDACQGDSGGPLQVFDDDFVSTIFGITSFGLDCATEVPGVYARVAYYLDWIESIVWP